MARTPTRRVGKLEMQIRIEEVVGLIAQGKQRTTIQEEICSLWDVKPPTAKLYMRKALDHISKALSQERVKQLAKAVLRYEYIYKLALEEKDLKTALTAQNSLSKLLSLDRVSIPQENKERKDGESLEIEYDLTDTV